MYTITKDKFLSQIELITLKERINDIWIRDVLIIKLGLATGARAQELLNLTHDDLDIQNQTIYIRGLKSSDNREIPIEKQLFEALIGLPRHETLFNCTYSWLVKVWSRYTNGLTDKSFKSLRHTVAINLYRKTKDLQLVKILLGHRNVFNTMVYSDYIYRTEELKCLLEIQ